MKASLYILELSNGQYYIGSTPDLDRRIAEHQNAKVISTKGKLPCKLVYFCIFKTLPDARSAEYKLKKYKNKEVVRQIVIDQEIRFIKQSK